MSGAKATRTTAATIGPDLHEDAAGPPRAPAALGRWGRALARRRRLVAALWLALAAGSAALLPGLTGRLTPPSLEVPGSPSAVAAAVIARGFPGQGTEQVLLAFSSPTLAAREPLYQRTVAAVARALDARPDVGALLPLPPVGGQAERHAYVLAGVLGDEPARQRNLPGQLADARRAALQASGGAVGVTILGVSRAFAQLAHTDFADLRETESMTVPLAGLLLVLGLGALGAAAVPLLVGGAAILTALGALALASRFWPVDSTVLTYTVTMAVGLGLDYTLIILLRYRQARHAGRPPVTAAAHATATAGGTVAWCALAILVTSAALLVVGVPWARSMALAGMLAAGVTAPAALTLAPALLPLLDRRLGWGTLPWRRPGRERSPAWTRGAAHLMRHPVRYATAAVVLLLLAAAPVLHLRTGLHYDRDTLSGTDMGGGLAQLERDGLAGLTSLALPHPPGTPPVDTTALAAALRADPRVSLVSAFDNGRDLTLMLVADRFAPDGEQAAAFQRDLRALAARLLPPGQRVHAVGPAARLADLSAAALTGLWRVLPVVLPASFVLLLVTFRSLLIPLKAVAMNLLCVGATFGLLTLAFQDTGRTPDVNVLLPLVIFTLVFGLSLDYEVFLVHRVHEHYRRTGDNTAAVLHGLRHTARPVTLAAAIMAVTFAGLMFTRRADFQQGGFAVAVAIVLDATLIRMVLVPALMRLLGRHNWWLPGAQRRRNAAISGTSRSWASSST